MSQKFKLQVVRLACQYEQHMEWGRDEIRLFGFAISRRGHLFALGFRDLGSWSTGDVRDSGVFPMTLCESDLEDDGLEVLIYLWLIEEDGGGVGDAASHLEARFREEYAVQAARLLENRYPRDCIPFTAFYKTVIVLQSELDEAATEGRNDDVFLPIDVVLERDSTGAGPFGGAVAGLNYSREMSFTRAKGGGTYDLTIRYSYAVEPVVFG